MRKAWVILALLSISVFAFETSEWIAALDTTRADLLTEARVNVGPAEPAEDTELEFSLACTELSDADRTLTLEFFRAVGENFQVGFGVDSDGDTTNGHDVVTSFIYARNEIEK